MRKNIFITFVILTSIMALPAGVCKYLDMTYKLAEGIPYYPLVSPFDFVLVANGTMTVQNKSFWLQFENVNTSTHMGTHVDAPCHFAKGRWCIDQIPLERFILPGIVVDITEKASSNPNATVSVNDLKNWECKHGRITDGSMVIMRSGWGKRWPDKRKYLGTTTLDPTKLRCPGFSAEAARWLVKNRNIYAVAVDTVSLDPGYSLVYDAHTTFLANNIYGVENMANVEALPYKGATILSTPINIQNSSGAPVRIIAQVPTKVK